uniref:Protein kinase domain-containing protein n=1 Tax=Arcella intermedia TaxID=1963864 RepID=A0A6B2L2F5_9EUKA
MQDEFVPPEQDKISKHEVHIEEKIGKGSFGVVYRGRCRGVEVAVKVLTSQNWSDIEDLIHEVQIMSALRNPNVLLYMGMYEYETDSYAIVMEFLPRGNLHDVLHNKSINLPLSKQMQFGVDICKGMAWLAAKNIIHRDLKPANVLIDQNWVCKICDFGLSEIIVTKKFHNDEDDAPGSVLWMAPEVLLRENRKVDSKLDVYSFAYVFWETLTRDGLFTEYKVKEVFVKDVAKEGKRPSLAKVHPLCHGLLGAAWHRDPEQRPSFEQLVDLLNGLSVDVHLDKKVFPDESKFWKKKFQCGFNAPSADKFAEVYTSVTQSFNAGLHQSCIKRLLSEKEGSENVIPLEKFVNYLKWFGKGNKGLDRLERTMKQPWFAGAMDSSTAEKTIAASAKPVFLVRLNVGGSVAVETAPFVITRVAKDKTVHTRVYKQGSGFLMENAEKVQISTDNFDIVELLEKAQKANFVPEPLSCNPFNDLFSVSQKAVYEVIDT